MRIATGLDTNGPLERTIARAERLAAMGLRDLWASQIFGPDTLTVLALVGRAVPALNLGTAVVPVQPRHPAMLAAQARTVQEAIGGRLSLGVGLSHQVVVEGSWGIAFDRPASYMEEYLEALAPMLRGEPVQARGERVTAVVPTRVGPREVDPPGLLVAALGPRMLEMAGRLTDGTLTWMTGPETVRTHVAPLISEAAARAGRPAPRVVCALPVAVTDDVAATRALTNEALKVYPTLPSYAAMMAREGATTPADLAIIGSREQVADAIGRLPATGITEFSANVTGGPAEREATLDLLAELARP
jgi:F420-dependent oxidoreductase-like protein